MRREDNAGSFYFLRFVPSSVRFVRSSANNALARPPSCSSSPVYTTLLSQPSYFTFVLAGRAIVHRVENRTNTLSFAKSLLEGSFLEHFVVTPNEGRENDVQVETTYFSLMIFYFFSFSFFFRHAADEFCNNFRFSVAVLKRKK